ncbi:MAG: hypothetical protein RJA90_645, partial [Bacteroidota bacterium]
MRTFSFKRDKTSFMYIINRWCFSFIFLSPLISIAQIGVSIGGTLNNAAGWAITDLNNSTTYD